MYPSGPVALMKILPKKLAHQSPPVYCWGILCLEARRVGRIKMIFFTVLKMILLCRLYWFLCSFCVAKFFPRHPGNWNLFFWPGGNDRGFAKEVHMLIPPVYCWGILHLEVRRVSPVNMHFSIIDSLCSSCSCSCTDSSDLQQEVHLLD